MVEFGNGSTIDAGMDIWQTARRGAIPDHQTVAFAIPPETPPPPRQCGCSCQRHKGRGGACQTGPINLLR